MASIEQQNKAVITPYSDIPYLPFEDSAEPEDLTKVRSFQAGFGSKVLRIDRQGLWLGAEAFADAPFSVDMLGNVTASSITISGYIPTGGALTDIGAGNITGTYIANGAISTAKIQANAITATEISAGAVTASKISVSTLSAISANIGTVTAGSLSAVTISGSTITGTTLTTANSGQRVVLTSTFAEYYNSSGTNIVNTLASSSSFIIQAQTSTGSIYFDHGSSGTVAFLSNGTIKAVFDGGNNRFTSYTNGGVSLGAAGANWADLYMNGDFVYRGVDQPIIYHGTISGTSVLNDNTAFTVTNGSTGIYVVTHNFGTDNYSVNVTPFASTVKNITVSSQGTNSFTVRIANLSDVLENNDFFFQVMLMP